MRTVTRMTASLVACLLGVCGPAIAAEDGRPLLTEAWSRVRALETERTVLDVLIVAAPDKPQYRPGDITALLQEGRRGVVRKRAVQIIQYAETGTDRLRIFFSEPREDRGTGFLVWRRPDARQDEQWLFLPALKRVRRIPASSTQTFVGSNFTYEDVRHLTSEPLQRYDYAMAGEETVDGQPCQLVRAAPHADAASAYGQRVIAIAKNSLFPIRVSYTDPSGAPWKVLTNVELHEVAPKVWRPVLTEMRDLKLDQTTVIVFSDREVNPVLDPALFTEDALARWAGD